MRTAARPTLCAAILLSLWTASSVRGAAEASGDGREIVVVVDTSRSMRSQDRRRYTSQILRILADVAGPGDRLTVVRMSGRDQCGAGAEPDLALERTDRGSFSAALDRHLAFNTGTHFAAALRTAAARLRAAAARPRLLLVLADAGGLGSCAHELSSELMALRRDGVDLAAVHLGRGRGAFEGHGAFSTTVTAPDAERLIAAVAQIYQQFLGVKTVASGAVEAGRIDMTVAPFVERAFLVVAADGDVGPIEPGPGVGPVFEGARGHTVGLDGQRRSYRIVRLDAPAEGHRRFQLPSAAPAGWMLVQESALRVRALQPPVRRPGEAARVVVEVYDRRTGERVADAGSLPDLALTLAGAGSALNDDGVGADLRAGDGRFSAWLGGATDGHLDLRLQSRHFDQLVRVEPPVDPPVTLRLAPPPALEFGRLAAGDIVDGVLDLSASTLEVAGGGSGAEVAVAVTLGSDFSARRVQL
ncbi:MAG: VWA domain-containing protein, partial [Acidobacteriota bacterium]